MFVLAAGLLGLAGAGLWYVQRARVQEAPAPPDAGTCGRLLVALAAGVLVEDDRLLRAHVHPDLLARLPKDRALSAQLREVLPDPPVLVRFADARFAVGDTETLAPGRVRVRISAELGGGARFESTLQLGAHEGTWKLLGMAQ